MQNQLALSNIIIRKKPGIVFVDFVCQIDSMQFIIQLDWNDLGVLGSLGCPWAQWKHGSDNYVKTSCWNYSAHKLHTKTTFWLTINGVVTWTIRAIPNVFHCSEQFLFTAAESCLWEEKSERDRHCFIETCFIIFRLGDGDGPSWGLWVGLTSLEVNCMCVCGSSRKHYQRHNGPRVLTL